MKRIRYATQEEAKNFIENHIHKLDRSHYDTPGTIRDCPCNDCNAYRERHGLPIVKYRIKTVETIEFDNSEPGINEVVTSSYQIYGKSHPCGMYE